MAYRCEIIANPDINICTFGYRHCPEATSSDAKTAAASAYASTSAIPVVGPFLAPEAAAGAFAAVMAFDQGGIVPGVNGGRDSVDAVLGPDEMVLPKPLSIGLQQMIKDGVAGKGGDTHHLHYTNHYHVNTIDGDGMRGALEAHRITRWLRLWVNQDASENARSSRGSLASAGSLHRRLIQ